MFDLCLTKFQRKTNHQHLATILFGHSHEPDWKPSVSQTWLSNFCHSRIANSAETRPLFCEGAPWPMPATIQLGDLCWMTMSSSTKGNFRTMICYLFVVLITILMGEAHRLVVVLDGSVIQHEQLRALGNGFCEF